MIEFEIVGKTLSKGEKRKIEIINAAINCINDHGIESLTLESIGKSIGINKAHVAYYFKKKEEIVLLAIKYIALNARAYVDDYIKSQSTALPLFSYIEAHRMWIDKFRKHGVVYTLFFHYCTFNNDYRKMNSGVRQLGKIRIIELLKLSQFYKESKDSVALEFAANTIQQLIQSALIDCVALDGNSDDVFEITKKQIHLLLGK